MDGRRGSRVTDKTDVKIAELVARFEQAVIDHGNLCNLYNSYQQVRNTRSIAFVDLFDAVQDARVVRDSCRLELLQFVSKKEAAE